MFQIHDSWHVTLQIISCVRGSLHANAVVPFLEALCRFKGCIPYTSAAIYTSYLLSYLCSYALFFPRRCVLTATYARLQAHAALSFP